MTRPSRKIVIALGLLCVVCVVTFLLWPRAPKSDIPANFETTAVTRGDLVKTVTANGTLNPVKIVNIGTQVSGIILSIAVDFNDKVKPGEELARLDTRTLEADVAEKKAGLQKAEAQQRYSALALARARTLYAKDFISRAELDQAETSQISATQDVTTANSQLERSQTNLGYAVITSPVAGVVISREVDVGQTVASSFQTPTLFKIAEDLTQMQIQASISEADIGMVAKDQPVTFTVDAYPDRSFEGKVDQIRLNPTTESNVVTYTVVINIANPDLSLLPGMTAFVSIQSAKANDALLIPSAALRFTPPREGAGKRQHPAAPTGNRIYVWRGGHVVPVAVTKQLDTLAQAAVSSENLHEGDLVITGMSGGAKNSASSKSTPHVGLSVRGGR